MNPVHASTNSSIDARVNALVAHMTLDEKISQMMNDAPGIERLDIPKYNWWNEALHGVARAGLATVFPQAIGLGATWNRDLLHRIADVIANEGRAKYHEAARRAQNLYRPHLLVAQRQHFPRPAPGMSGMLDLSAG